MEAKQIYCPGCDRLVSITVTPGPAHGGHANLPDGPELVCLDFGEGCSEGSCPIAGVAPIVMAVRLARSGLREADQWERVVAFCEGCAEPRDMEVLDGSHAYCEVCGSTRELLLLKTADGGYLAVTREGAGG